MLEQVVALKAKIRQKIRQLRELVLIWVLSDVTRDKPFVKKDWGLPPKLKTKPKFVKPAEKRD